jgi:hypothetical protein
MKEPLSFFFENTAKLNNEEICFYSQRNYLQRNFEEGMRLLGLQFCVLPSGIKESAQYQRKLEVLMEHFTCRFVKIWN